MAKRNNNTWTVSGASVAALVRFARDRGVDLTDILASHRLPLPELALPECRVEVSVNDALWVAAAERLRDPELGLHFAERLDLDGFHIVVHLALTSRTVGLALERIVAYSRLLHDAGRTEIEHTAEGRVLLFPGCRGLPVPPLRHIAEFSSASAVILIRAMTGVQSWKPEAIHYTFPRPPSITVHRAILGVVPTFGAVEDCIVLSEDTLGMETLRTGPEGAAPYLERYAQTLLSQLPPIEAANELRGHVLRAIVTGLAQGGVTLDEVATRLSMTPRTLQRRLADSNDRFADLVEEARRSAAEHYLRQGVMPLSEISFLLGVQDPATFSKAFKRWSGETPGAFRERARVTAGSTSSRPA